MAARKMRGILLGLLHREHGRMGIGGGLDPKFGQKSQELVWSHRHRSSLLYSPPKPTTSLARTPMGEDAGLG